MSLKDQFYLYIRNIMSELSQYPERFLKNIIWLFSDRSIALLEDLYKNLLESKDS